ncbi:hypothetical protein FRC04_007557 [Tulasnella sp. 424]|nr:hypothetical protein FRC04_007557 [Tulasnella sp. 424]KAG8978992.1 hypothetical protein FRC05_009202 [Tulasnella sp. 425]
MRSTFLYTLLGFAVASIAVPSGIEPAGELQPKLLPKAEKRQVTAIDGLKSREIGGGFIAVLPKDSSDPVEGDDGSAKRRGRYLRKDEIVVPDSLQEPSSKRALYCKNSGYGLCPSRTYCCPLGGLCCSGGGCCKKGQRCCTFDGCCPSTYNCVIVNGKEGCCPIGKTCTTSGNGCVDAGYVPCNNYNFCCKPGYTCYRDSLGTNLCRAPGSNNNNDPTTTKRTTTTTTTTPYVYQPTTFKIPDYTTTTTTPPAFAFPTTTPGNLPANTTSSASRSASSVDIPLTANANGASSSGVGYSILMTAVLFALCNVLVVA